jgi:hypothetical protein
MRKIWTALAAAALSTGAAAAEPISLAAHRAGYEIALGGANSDRSMKADAPVSASGLIAYEFRGSACEGYTSNFRQLTELQRSEGGAVASDINAVSFEDAGSKLLRFEITTQTGADAQPQVSGSAARSDDGGIGVDLVKPGKEKVTLGHDVYFPTQHIERIIETAEGGGRVLEARVFDGSDTGKKVYSTLAIIGLERKGATPDSDVAPKLADLKRWPVTISYFNEANKDAAPDYTMAFDLYVNGVSGSLKLDYGSFALAAKLKKFDFLPEKTCGK